MGIKLARKKMRQTAICTSSIIVIVLSVLSCAWTRIDSQINPEYSDRQYQKLLVFVALYDIGDRQSAEKRIQEEMDDYGAVCLLSHELFFAGRSYTDNEMLDILDRNEVDAILIIDPYASGESQTYIPQSTSTETRGTVTESFDGYYTLKTKSNTMTNGGYYVSKPWARYSLQLFDANTGDVVWFATASSRGNAFANWGTLMNSVASKTVKKLFQDKLLFGAEAPNYRRDFR
jgi:hypothetical protein